MYITTSLVYCTFMATFYVFFFLLLMSDCLQVKPRHFTCLLFDPLELKKNWSTFCQTLSCTLGILGGTKADITHTFMEFSVYYSFSMNTITSHHKLSSSKQHKFIIPQFCRWEKAEHSVAQLIPLLRNLRCQNQGIHSPVFSSADCRREYVFLIIQAIGRI